jgi:hypothetical protein
LQLAGTNGVAGGDLLQRIDHARAAERGPAGQRFVQDRAQCVDIRRRPDFPCSGAM